MNYPAYLESYNNGKLQKAKEESVKLLGSCAICPRKCKVNRLEGNSGFCLTGVKAKVYSSMLHHGEEPPISGKRGSGTIFFSNCNLRCIYCQNYEFSQLGQGREVNSEELASIMLELQSKGAHNINLVTPTHVMPQILEALVMAVPKGLAIPLVYNTSGYELANIIKLLDKIVDIYLADMRYGKDEEAREFSAAQDYPRYNREAVREMHRQTGEATINNDGIMVRGLLIRHLVLPNNVSGTKEVMRFLRDEISADTYVSLMSQYLPYHKARSHQKINRRLKENEYEQAQEILANHGLHNGWVQESYGSERFAGVHIKPSLLKDG